MNREMLNAREQIQDHILSYAAVVDPEKVVLSDSVLDQLCQIVVDNFKGLVKSSAPITILNTYRPRVYVQVDSIEEARVYCNSMLLKATHSGKKFQQDLDSRLIQVYENRCSNSNIFNCGF